MIYVLDTDILRLLGHKDSPEAPRIRRRIAELPDKDAVVTTIISYEEQMRGWMSALARTKSSKTEVDTYARLLDHLETFRRLTVLKYDAAAAAIAVDLRGNRISVGSMDLKIPSIVFASDAVLITRNVVDFRKVPKLGIEDWAV